MKRLVLLPVVLALSGVPAAAVVCDLLLCVARATPATAEPGCHEHAAPTGQTQVRGSTDDCTHLFPADPYVASGLRLTAHLVAWTPLQQMLDAARTRARSTSPSPSHGPPDVSYAGSSLPLRI